MNKENWRQKIQKAIWARTAGQEARSPKPPRLSLGEIRFPKPNQHQ